ncbi:MAG: hypothetical protein IKN78_01430 [Bacteroidales bacterium]|nr:hypothetical protein [Bacteroidales bacterium]
MSQFFDAIKKLLDSGKIDQPNESHKSGKSKVTNKILFEELVDHFNNQINELSVYRRLLYPMSFNILMHPDDYSITKESLPFVLPEVVSAFYASIKKKISSYHNGVNYAPPATYWFFQFSACQVKEKDGVEDFIKRGEIVTTGSLTTFDIHKAQQGGIRSEANVHLSVKCQNSNTNDNNINMDALLGMDILSEGSFTFNFDKNLNEDTSSISSAAGEQRRGWATLRWASEDGTGNFKVYDMFDNYIEISGKSETRITSNIVKINSDAVVKQHVHIKFDQATQTFSLAAFAKTRLNSREVPLSLSGSVPQWVPLSKSSKIFLNDVISVEFNANSDLV